MLLTIFWVCRLASAICCVDAASCTMERLAFSMISLAAVMSRLASPVFPAFCRVMDSSSSREAAVSSRVAACSEADSERFWAISFEWPTASAIFTRMVLTDCAS
ncbi:MAG: hypothetical protein A4E67_00981 [Syntrophaceae bacterium PtaB.Bin038]|nr:MAG: hypothetical protein A4E67_00981 [Syntrophaceae bacterium PtaB.Bin038]